MEDECAAWLRAQAEADIKAAGEATPGPWEFEGDDPTDDELFTTHEDSRRARFGDTVAYVRGRSHVANGRHMERHDPRDAAARAESVLSVLDEYEAKWKLAVEAWERDEGAHALYDQARTLKRTVRKLAYGYRFREGYEEAWKP